MVAVITNSPEKASEPRIKNDGMHPISVFDELVVFLKSDLRFENYGFESPDIGVVSLEHEGVTIIFLAPEHWRDFEQFRPYHEMVNSPSISIVCCGKEKELALRPHEEEHSNIHILSFPTTCLQLEFQVRSYFKAKKLHQVIVEDVRKADETSNNVKLVLQISRELNGIRDVPRLLGLILEKAREVTQADAGSIYVVEKATEEKEGSIVFKICQNESVPQDLTEFRMPISDQSIVGNAAIFETSINIPDLYKLDLDPKKNPYNAKHDTSWEKRIGYECHSMLTLPMFDISHTVIGVIQLINCKTGAGPLKTKEDFIGRTIPFNETAVEYAEIIAHQAGIALENALLTEEKQALFEGFVDASVNAIEQRDPTTSGHSHRVAKLTLGLARIVNQCEIGLYRDTYFTDKHMKEIEYASLLHDFGKIAVREEVLLKAKKLFPHELDLLLERFEIIRSRYEIDHLKELVNYLQAPDKFPPGMSPDYFVSQTNLKLTKLKDYLDFILKSNEPTVLEQGGFERLKDIANLKFKDSTGIVRPFLHKRELTALSVSRGSLTSEEFAEIQSHVSHTYDFLRKIPWGSELANVPQIAAKHHEKLDGSGYPSSAFGSEIPIQSRMMTIADIFDALTAADRPYKKAVPVDKALDILSMEVKSQKCDPDLFKLFVESKIYESVL